MVHCLLNKTHMKITIPTLKLVDGSTTVVLLTKDNGWYNELTNPSTDIRPEWLKYLLT